MWSQTFLKFCLKVIQSCLKVVLMLSKSCVNFVLGCLKVDPKLSQPEMSLQCNDWSLLSNHRTSANSNSSSYSGNAPNNWPWANYASPPPPPILSKVLPTSPKSIWSYSGSARNNWLPVNSVQSAKTSVDLVLATRDPHFW